jgi:gliding motility-associated-like protein
MIHPLFNGTLFRMMLRIAATVLFGLLLSTARAQVCDATGNLMIYSNYEGGELTINVDQNIPGLRVGICTYESVTVNFTGPFVGNITEVIYAGFDSANGPCGNDPSTTTINGVPANIVTMYSNTLGNIAITNYLGEEVVAGFNVVNCMAGAEGECSVSTLLGGNSAPQIVQFFLAEFAGSVLYAHQVQYPCFNGTFNVSEGGNCCLTDPGTPLNPIYAGNATYDLFPNPDTLLCAGSVSLDVSYYTGIYSVLWSTGSTAETITVTQPGTYAVAIGDYCHILGLTPAIVDTIEVLSCCLIGGVDATVNPISCGGAGDGAITVTPLAAGPYTYSWNTVPAQTTPSITGLDGGTYTLTLTNAADCDTTLTFTLVEPGVLTLDIAGVTPVCAQAPTTATALVSGGTGPIDIAWSTGASGPGITYAFDSSGPLLATATDASGCTASDTLFVVVQPLPTAAITASDDTLCAGGTVTLTAQAPDATSLSWVLGSAGPAQGSVVTATYTATGEEIISLQAFGLGGCASETVSDTLRVFASPQLQLVAGPVICERAISAQVFVAGADNCTLWLNGTPVAATCSGISTLPVSAEGDYGLVLTASNAAGCADTLSTTVTVSDAPGLYVPNAFSPNGDGFNERFIPSAPDQGDRSVLRIFDRWGKELFTTNDPGSGWDGTAGGEPVPDGVYAYLLRTPDPCAPKQQVLLRGHVTVLR